MIIQIINFLSPHTYSLLVMAENLSEIGDFLKRIRLKKGITALDASEILNIKVKYLDLLENGKFDEDLDLIYLVGYLKSYLDFLNIHHGGIIEEYKRIISNKFDKKHEASNKISVHKIRPSIAQTLLGLFIFFSVYAVWNYAYSVDKESLFFDKR